MNKPIIKRLTELEKEFFRDVWADITYNDGRKERLKIIDVLNFYIGLYCYTQRYIIIIEQIMNETLGFV